MSALGPRCLAWLLPFLFTAPLAAQPTTAPATQPFELTYSDQSAQYVEGHPGLLKLTGVSGQTLYPTPQRLLPLDQHVNQLVDLALPPTPATVCQISQASDGDRPWLLVNAGDDSDDLKVYQLFSLTMNAQGDIEIQPGAICVFENAVLHRLAGTVVMAGYTFESDPVNPLVFKVDYVKGYVYVSGQGSVRDPNGRQVQLADASPAYVAGSALATADSAVGP